MNIKIKKTDYDAIITHCKTGFPNESCGLIAGRDDGDIRVIEKVYPLINLDKSNQHFSIDPREQLQAVKDMRSLGISPLGNFHSHPETPARPSEEDIRLAYDSKASYLILSLADETPVLKAFHIDSNGVVEISIEVN